MTEPTPAKNFLRESPAFKRLADESEIGADLFEQVLLRTGKGFRTEATKTDYAKLLQVASDLKLSIVLRQIYMIETKQGPQVVIPIDGWLHIMHRHPEYLAHDVVENYETVIARNKAGEIVHDKEGRPVVEQRLVSATCKLWTRKREGMKLGPYSWTEYLSECYVPPRGGYDGPWQTHTSRMLRHKAASQCVRYELGVYVPTEDEFARAGQLLDDVIERTNRGEARDDTRPDAKPLAPSIPIAGMQRPALPPPPAGLTLDVKPEPVETQKIGSAPADAESPVAESREQSRDAGPASASSTDFDAEESARVDREEAAKQGGGLFRE